ncbi:CDP-diacylglycerol--serine O-phosphatidyltransferase [soil metagenome]
MLKHLPNAITCLNLFLGCLALYYAFQGQLVVTAFLVFAAAVFDFLDGMVARLLQAYSEIGKQLDSLADMVSFGVVPGVTMFMLISQGIKPGVSNMMFMPFSGFLITIFSALRLAKFNIDTRQTSSFIGLPTPACTLFVVSLPLILAYDTLGLSAFILNPIFLYTSTLVLSYLLIAELPLFALKFSNLRWQENAHRFVFLILSVVMLALLQFTAIPLIIIIYIIISIFKAAQS